MPTDRWMDKEDMVYIYTMEYYSAIRKNEVMLSAVAQMDLEIIRLSEVSREQKDKHHMIPLTCRI